MKNYKEKKEKIMEKYDRAIRAIAYANNVDMGVALDMLEENVLRDGRYAYVNVEEAKKDFEELDEIAKGIAEPTEPTTEEATSEEQ